MGWHCQLCQGLRSPGGDTWLRLGLRRANKHLAAWVGTGSPVSAQPWGGSCLTNKRMQEMSCCEWCQAGEQLAHLVSGSSTGLFWEVLVLLELKDKVKGCL